MTNLETDLKAARKRMTQLEGHLRDVRDRFREEKQEWYQFQADLQKAVVIANDFKTEAQEDMEKIINENLMLKEKNEKLKAEVERVHEEAERMKYKGEIRGRMMSTVDRELANLRQGIIKKPGGIVDGKSGPNQAISVKNLIATIEDQAKVKSPPGSPLGLPVGGPSPVRRDSSDSSVSISSIKSDLSSKLPPDSPSASKLLKRPSDAKERTPITHRHTVANIIYESPVTDDAKGVAPPKTEPEAGGKKPLTSILSNKSALRRTSIR